MSPFDGPEYAPGTIHDIRGAWCHACNSGRSAEVGEDLSLCACEAIAADIEPAELALDREISRSARRLVVLAGAQSLIERPEGR